MPEGGRSTRLRRWHGWERATGCLAVTRRHTGHQQAASGRWRGRCRVIAGFSWAPRCHRQGSVDVTVDMPPIGSPSWRLGCPRGVGRLDGGDEDGARHQPAGWRPPVFRIRHTNPRGQGRLLHTDASTGEATLTLSPNAGKFRLSLVCLVCPYRRLLQAGRCTALGGSRHCGARHGGAERWWGSEAREGRQREQ